MARVKVGSRYSVYEEHGPAGWDWSPDGLAVSKMFGTYAMHAVEVWEIVGDTARCGHKCAGRWTEEMIPLSAFGERIPDTDYHPGAWIEIRDSKGLMGTYRVETADDTDYHVDHYTVRRSSRGRAAPLVLDIDSGVWRFGAAGKVVEVTRA